MATSRNRGDLTLRERPDSPEWDFSTQKITCTRTFEGLYNDLLSTRPTVGGTMAGIAYGLLVETIKIKKSISGKATMTVVMQVDVADGDNEFPEPVQPVYEVEWTQLERPIEQHPKYKSLFPDPKGTQAFTSDQITALNNFVAWDNATDATTKQTAYGALSNAFKTLAQKKMRGTTTYLLFAPVARITTLARNVTLAAKCGVIFGDVPNFSELPENYEWLSTADRSTRTGTHGKWQRVQEWTGADTWDSDIYTDDSSNTDDPGSGNSNP